MSELHFTIKSFVLEENSSQGIASIIREILVTLPDAARNIQLFEHKNTCEQIERIENQHREAGNRAWAEYYSKLLIASFMFQSATFGTSLQRVFIQKFIGSL